LPAGAQRRETSGGSARAPSAGVTFLPIYCGESLDSDNLRTALECVSHDSPRGGDNRLECDAKVAEVDGRQIVEASVLENDHSRSDLLPRKTTAAAAKMSSKAAVDSNDRFR
jgi:hypothetical protein